MKKLILALLVGFAPLVKMHAQPKPGKAQQIETLKIAFISNRLALTPEEAQKFWPVFNQYSIEFKQLRKEYNGLPDKDELKWEEAQLNLRKKYKPEFLKCIPQQKFDKMLRVEKEWKEKVKQELQRRQNQGRINNHFGQMKLPKNTNNIKG